MRTLLFIPLTSVVAFASLAWGQSSGLQPTDQPEPTAPEETSESRGLETQPTTTLAPVGVRFDTSSSELSPEAMATLDETAGALKQDPKLHVSVEGNTDIRGTPELNEELGAKRAEQVTNYLVEQGVNPDQLKASSNGENDPVCDDTSQICLSQNRRAAIAPLCKER